MSSCHEPAPVRGTDPAHTPITGPTYNYNINVIVIVVLRHVALYLVDKQKKPFVRR